MALSRRLRLPVPLVLLFSALSLPSCGGDSAPPPAMPNWTPASASPSIRPWNDDAPTAAGTKSPPPATPSLIVAAPDRSSEDIALDAGRHPLELLEFFELKPGMRVAELGAGGGYTTELLARAVAPNGTVYGQNSRFVLERFAEQPWSARLAKPVMKSVVRLDREFDDPFPESVRGLDAVMSILVYHDTVWLKYDRDRMNRAVFDALRSGGAYFIVDHSGRPGTGIEEAQTLHRIEEKVLRDEVMKAGFLMAKEGDFLRNPGDTRDWNASPKSAAERRGKSDRFVLKFVKP